MNRAPGGITLTIHPDEACWGLEENSYPVPTKGRRRLQRTFVIRGDEIAEYNRDLGAAEDFDANPIRVVAIGEDTVAHVWALADEARWNDPEQPKRIATLQEASTLKSDFLRLLEEMWLQRTHRSIFGPGGHTQRN